MKNNINNESNITKQTEQGQAVNDATKTENEKNKLDEESLDSITGGSAPNRSFYSGGPQPPRF